MFENTTLPPSNLPIRPAAPAMPPMPEQPLTPPPPSGFNPVRPSVNNFTPTPPPAPVNRPVPLEAPPQPRVFTMPDKFRAGDGKKYGGSRSTKKLVIILIVVTAVAALGIAGLYAFQNVFNQPANENTNSVVVNGNRNTNLNLNQNANGNTNLNQNVNLNLNQNVNQNANLNANANSNLNQNTNTSTATTPLPSSTDSDQDGLTNIEEAVYSTDQDKPDSDGDGFIDGRKLQTDGTVIGELYNGYNPAGTGRLEDATDIVKRQANNTNQYSVLIPKAWTAVLDSSGGIMITPAQTTGEYFQIRINENATRQTPLDWFRTISPTAELSLLDATAFNGFEVIWSEDSSTAYLFKDTKVYSVQYTTGSLTEVNYWTTFDMIVRSFKLVTSN